ncbi:hypothetical protein E0L93_08405 [Rubrobacter taiwanensis]|uniref:DUF4386 family protein n=1 Tax=Rubrobacter taiwanensis TaxID=185139 RepID=A0A4R1BHM4_9ACTN|nr:hypothetical protein [Rubrobacter taiwanensis]TCJ16739.1 hypothetical protein E0L93_08405 [Rubrobacter taiwanensis]
MPATRIIRWSGAAAAAGGALGFLGFLISLLHPLYSSSSLLALRLGFLSDLLPLPRYVTAIGVLGHAQFVLTAAGVVGVHVLLLHRSGGKLPPKVSALGVILVLAAVVVLVSSGFYALGRGDSATPVPYLLSAVFNSADTLRLAGILLAGVAALLAQGLVRPGVLLFVIAVLESDAVYALLLLRPVSGADASFGPATSVLLQLLPPAALLAWMLLGLLLLSSGTKEAPAG